MKRRQSGFFDLLLFAFVFSGGIPLLFVAVYGVALWMGKGRNGKLMVVKAVVAHF